MESDQVSSTYTEIDQINLGEKKVLYFTEYGAHVCYPWITADLDVLFPTFFFRDWRSRIVYIPCPHLSSEILLTEFFGLQSNEFVHCFSPYRQDKLYGKKKLYPHSRPKDNVVAIKQFMKHIKKRILSETNVCERKVLFEKIGNKHPSRFMYKTKSPE